MVGWTVLQREISQYIQKRGFYKKFWLNNNLSYHCHPINCLCKNSIYERFFPPLVIHLIYSIKDLKVFYSTYSIEFLLVIFKFYALVSLLSSDAMLDGKSLLIAFSVLIIWYRKTFRRVSRRFHTRRKFQQARVAVHGREAKKSFRIMENPQNLIYLRWRESELFV